MKNIQDTISPLLVVLCLCGFGVFEYPRGRPRLYFTILYILILWLLYIYGVIETKIFLSRSITHNIDLFLITKISIVFSILIIPLSLYYNKRFKRCLKNLSIVNDTLEKLGTPKNYAKLRTQIIWLLIGWIAFIFSVNILDSLWLLKEISIAITICVSFIMNQSLHINMLSDVFHMILLRYIGSPFEQINQHIEKLTELKKRQVRHIWTTPSLPLVCRYITGIKTAKQIILILMHVHLELCLLTRELTTIFGIYLVMQAVTFNIFTMQIIIKFYNTITSFNIESVYENKINIFVMYVWIAINVIKIVIFNCICEEVCSKAKQAETFLNRVKIHMLDIEIQEYIMQFLFQLSYQPLEISRLGIHFGYKYLQQCTKYVGMIIIVTTQLDLPNAQELFQ